MAFIANEVTAQIPQGLNYQAVAVIHPVDTWEMETPEQFLLIIKNVESLIHKTSQIAFCKI